MFLLSFYVRVFNEALLVVSRRLSTLLATENLKSFFTAALSSIHALYSPGSSQFVCFNQFQVNYFTMKMRRATVNQPVPLLSRQKIYRNDQIKRASALYQCDGDQLVVAESSEEDEGLHQFKIGIHVVIRGSSKAGLDVDV